MVPADRDSKIKITRHIGFLFYSRTCQKIYFLTNLMNWNPGNPPHLGEIGDKSRKIADFDRDSKILITCWYEFLL